MVDVAVVQRLKSCDCAPLAVYVSNAMLYTDELYNSAIPPTISSPCLIPHVRFPSFVHPEHGTSHCNEMQEVGQEQGFCLEYMLQWREVDDEQLSDQRSRYGIIEHLVVEDANLACEH